MNKKTVNESFTTQVHMILSEDINGFGRLFGGRLMAWIDMLAGVVARRHSNKIATTICVDNLVFKAGVHIDDIIVLKGKITHVGRSSMEVKVSTYIEAVSGETQLVNEAYLVMVALDENEKPTPVPELELITQEEKDEWIAGEKRREYRQLRKKEEF